MACASAWGGGACSVGWTGHDCSKLDCSGKRCSAAVSGPFAGNTSAGAPTPPVAQVSHSTCLPSEPGDHGLPVSCECHQGWGGADCCEPQCPNGCDALHGRCVAPAHCACSEGWTGIDCSMTTYCEVVLEGCLGHGTCVGSACSCERGWAGEKCGLKVCPTSADGSLCGGASRGTCAAAPICLCDSDWGGDGCEGPLRTHGCSSHGVCVSVGRWRVLRGLDGARLFQARLQRRLRSRPMCRGDRRDQRCHSRLAHASAMRATNPPARVPAQRTALLVCGDVDVRRRRA